MTTDDELDMVETKRLVDALHRRCDGVLVVTASALDSEREARDLCWRGGFVVALGLLTYAQMTLAAAVNSLAAEGKDEGDDEP